MQDNVHQLRARECAVLDTDMIAVMQQTLGAEHCQQVVEEVAYQLTERLTRLESLAEDGDIEGVFDITHSIAGIAGQVGLQRMTVVAQDLMGCARSGDLIALRAVSARLIRIGEESLFSLAHIAV